MVDPTNVKDFNRTDWDLQEFAIFCVCVAGKPADVTAKKVDEFLKWEGRGRHRTPLSYIQALANYDILDVALMANRFGQYKRISKALTKLSQVDLRTVDLYVLQDIMGPKSARFFLMNTRPDVRVAALDTHILAELREEYPLYTWIPKATPAWGPMYRKLERLWLDTCDGRGVNPVDEDLRVWIKRSKIMERATR